MLWQHPQRAPILTGVLTTAGGLAFIADYDRYVSAFDVRTGSLLWQTRGLTSAQGWIMTYAAGGRQYIAVPFGVGTPVLQSMPGDLIPDLKHPNAGNALMVFALPK